MWNAYIFLILQLSLIIKGYVINDNKGDEAVLKDVLSYLDKRRMEKEASETIRSIVSITDMKNDGDFADKRKRNILYDVVNYLDLRKHLHDEKSKHDEKEFDKLVFSDLAEYLDGPSRSTAFHGDQRGKGPSRSTAFHGDQRGKGPSRSTAFHGDETTKSQSGSSAFHGDEKAEGPSRSTAFHGDERKKGPSRSTAFHGDETADWPSGSNAFHGDETANWPSGSNAFHGDSQGKNNDINGKKEVDIKEERKETEMRKDKVSNDVDAELTKKLAEFSKALNKNDFENEYASHNKDANHPINTKVFHGDASRDHAESSVGNHNEEKLVTLLHDLNKALDSKISSLAKKHM